MGYAPLFDSLTKGTLCGKWPDIGLWPIVLSLADWQGIVDVTPQFIAGVTGLATDEVRACMARFCEPDPASRSKAHDGARLLLLDPARDWGWRVVNIQLYRARASGRDQVADGRNAEKVRRYKERHRRTPEDTGGHTATPTNTKDLNKDEDSDKNPSREKTPSKGRACELPEGFALDEAMRDFALARFSDCDVARAFEQFKAHHMASGSKFKRWDMAWQKWVGNFAQYSYPKRSNGGWI